MRESQVCGYVVMGHRERNKEESRDEGMQLWSNNREGAERGTGNMTYDYRAKREWK